jgi:hypothetical protein
VGSTAQVSPRNVKPIAQNKFKAYGYLENHGTPSYMRVVDEIEFDVAVTATEGTETKGGIGIMVGSIGLGAQGKSDRENTSVSRIRFRIPLVLPNPTTSNTPNTSK